MRPPADGSFWIFARGVAVGAFCIGCFLGPDWLSVQLSKAKVTEVRMWKSTSIGEDWRHFADLIGLLDLLSLFARALLGPLRQWFALASRACGCCSCLLLWHSSAVHWGSFCAR